MSALNQLPTEIAEQLSGMVWAAAWHAANSRKGYIADATGDEIKFHNFYEELEPRAKGLEISTFTVDNVRWGAWNIAWHCADKDITNNLGGAQAAWNNHEGHFHNVRNKNEFTEELITNIQNFTFYAASHCTHSRLGNSEEARADRFKADEYYSNIIGKALLTRIDFKIDEVEVIDSQPLALIKQKLINESDRDQQQQVSYTKSESRTKSWGNTLGFTVGVEYETKAGFLCFYGGTKFSFSASFSHSWGESETSSEKRTYEFPVTVGGRQVIIAEARVTEAEMDVPYVATYTVGNVERRFEGIWRGVCVSSVEQKVNEPISIDDPQVDIDKLGVPENSNEPAAELVVMH